MLIILMYPERNKRIRVEKDKQKINFSYINCLWVRCYLILCKIKKNWQYHLPRLHPLPHETNRWETISIIIVDFKGQCILIKYPTDQVNTCLTLWTGLWIK